MQPRVAWRTAQYSVFCIDSGALLTVAKATPCPDTARTVSLEHISSAWLICDLCTSARATTGIHHLRTCVGLCYRCLGEKSSRTEHAIMDQTQLYRDVTQIIMGYMAPMSKYTQYTLDGFPLCTSCNRMMKHKRARRQQRKATPLCVSCCHEHYKSSRKIKIY